MLNVTSWVAALCSSTADEIPVAISLSSLIVPPMPTRGSLLDRRDVAGDLLGRLGRLIGQVLDLRRDDREALAGFTGARRLDRGVKGQEIGLAGDIVDQTHHLANLVRRLGQPLDHGVGAISLFHRLGSDGRRAHHLARDLADRTG